MRSLQGRLLRISLTDSTAGCIPAQHLGWAAGCDVGLHSSVGMRTGDMNKRIAVVERWLLVAAASNVRLLHGLACTVGVGVGGCRMHQ